MQNALVVGGNGFVGRAIVDDLLEYKQQKINVHILDIRKHKDFDTDEALKSIQFHIADLCDEQVNLKINIIFFVASKEHFAARQNWHRFPLCHTKPIQSRCHFEKG